MPKDKVQFIYKCFYGKEQIELLKHELSQTEWNKIVKTLDNLNTTCASFFDIFFKTNDKHFPEVRIKIKVETIQNPWITKGITNSSKKKEKRYERFLKKRTPQNEQKYKNCKGLLKAIKKAKKIYYSSKLLKCIGDIKKTWKCYERYNWKIKKKSTNFPYKLTINKMDVYNKSELANVFNDFFTNIKQKKLASQIPKSSKIFETYINKLNILMDSIDKRAKRRIFLAKNE